jgi:hypothetical protein
LTESKNLINNNFKQQDLSIPGSDSKFEIDSTPTEPSKNSALKISTYSYGSNGKRWYYLSKLSKKH